MNRRPEPTIVALAGAAWPSNRAAEAMQALARHAGLPVTISDPVVVPDDLPIEQVSSWIETVAGQSGIQADQAFVALDEIDVLLSSGAPVLVRLAAIEGAPFLAVLGRRGRFVRVLGSDL